MNVENLRSFGWESDVLFLKKRFEISDIKIFGQRVGDSNQISNQSFVLINLKSWESSFVLK